MADPKIKHVEMECPAEGCEIKAFVQVLIVEDKDLQKRIDKRADAKLQTTLETDHKEGRHDD